MFAVSISLSSCLSAWNNSANTRRIFIKFDIIFWKSIEKFQVLLKSGKNNGYFTWRSMYTYDKFSLNSSWNEKFFRQSCRVYQNAHFVFNNFLPRKSCRSRDSVENIVEPGKLEMTILGLLVACWISKATNTHSAYVILLALPLQQWLNERASKYRYTYIACLVSV